MNHFLLISRLETLRHFAHQQNEKWWGSISISLHQTAEEHGESLTTFAIPDALLCQRLNVHNSETLDTAHNISSVPPK